MIYTTGCWMCGAPADSREHRYKKSESKRLFPIRKNKYKPYVADELPLCISFDSGKVYSIKGPEANTEKYPRLICKLCNNEKTQRMDIAYDKLSTWCWENPEVTSINLNKMWGSDYQSELSYFYGYCIKILGCEILSSQCSLPADFPNPLNFKLENSNLILSICKSPTMAVIHPNFTKEMNYKIIGKKALLTSLERTSLEELGVKKILNLIWHRQIGNYQINFWFNIEPEPLLGAPLNGAKEIYDVPDLQIDCFDMDYVSNALIFGTTHNKWLAESSKEGHPYNQYKLGLRYATGNGVRWWKRSGP